MKSDPALSVLRHSWAKRIARYTKLVLVGKYTLGTISLVLIALVITIPLFDHSKSGARISFVSSTASHQDMPVMNRTKLQGVDTKNQPFTITADKVVQESEELVHLYNVQGDLLRANNSWLNMTANEGLYDSQSKHLVLTGNVTLYQDTGYNFTTERVEIDTKQAVASGKEEIQGEGPLGNMVAMGYEIADNGKRMHFGGSGRVHVHLNR